jgi:hypothetical protein
MKDLSKEDQERIESASKIFQDPQTFVSGAKFQHNHSFKSGFNEAIEEVRESLKLKIKETFLAIENGGAEYYPFDGHSIESLEGMKRAYGHFFEEIEKLKR